MSAATTSSSSPARHKHSAPLNSPYERHTLDITKEELDRIHAALKKEEFRKLFLDYVEEIQDPENRKRYEDEITQFEAERGVEVKFVNPEPGFVIKTSLNGALKCFINVAKNNAVAMPTNEVSLDPATGKRGLTWSLPMVQTAPRDDLDAQGKRCRVFDVIFHPDALYLAQRNSNFHKILVDTALDAVEREYQVKLDRTNLKFPKLDFKGMSRPTVIRKLAENPPSEAMEPHPLESIYPTKPTAESGIPKLIPMKTNVAAQPEFTTPEYSIKYRRGIDLAEYTNELDAKLNTTVPHELVVEIALPLLRSTAECQLDVTAKSVYLLNDRAGAKYSLKLDLPYIVNDAQGKARFDPDTRCLSIALPVVQKNAHEERKLHDTLLHVNREDSGVESDQREEMNSNGESPLEELSDSIEDQGKEFTETIAGADTTSDETTPPPIPFLKSAVHYQFPPKIDCNVLDNVMSLVLHVRNVQPESIASIRRAAKDMHLQFTSIGAGYYPTYYAFYLELPEDADANIEAVEAEAWENNLVLNLKLTAGAKNPQRYFAGLDNNDLKEYGVQQKFQVVHKSKQRTATPPPSERNLDDDEVSKKKTQQQEESRLLIAANTTEDDEAEPPSDGTQQNQQKKLNKKQKKKNKKRRSYSDSTYDDINVHEQKQQDEDQQQSQPLKQKLSGNMPQMDSDDDSSPERAEDAVNHIPNASDSVAVPKSTTAQCQRKQRSFSECHDSAASSSAGSSTFKGILKHYSRYGPNPSISDSYSSVDDSSLYSCSADAGIPISMRFSQSFSDIPEENVIGSLSESCKKTVRFSEVIKKQVFRQESSILGQRKKNQKRRDRKQRALQRRLSEGDCVDYEDSKLISLTDTLQYLKLKSNTDTDETEENADSDNTEELGTLHNGVDRLSMSSRGHDTTNHLKNRKCVSTPRHPRPRLESESSFEVDSAKNAMIFEMEMDM